MGEENGWVVSKHTTYSKTAYQMNVVSGEYFGLFVAINNRGDIDICTAINTCKYGWDSSGNYHGD
jgi:hypothetical protein